MSPEDGRSRPQAESGSSKNIATSDIQIVTAANDYLAEIDRAQADFAEGYHLGYWTGCRIGYAHAENDMAAAWAQTAAKIRQTLSYPTQDELRRRRGEAS